MWEYITHCFFDCYIYVTENHPWSNVGWHIWESNLQTTREHAILCYRKISSGPRKKMIAKMEKNFSLKVFLTTLFDLMKTWGKLISLPSAMTGIPCRRTDSKNSGQRSSGIVEQKSLARNLRAIMLILMMMVIMMVMMQMTMMFMLLISLMLTMNLSTMAS